MALCPWCAAQVEPTPDGASGGWRIVHVCRGTGFMWVSGAYRDRERLLAVVAARSGKDG